MIFDRSGYDLLSKVQTNRANIKLKYGFDTPESMSSLYNLSVIKFKSTFNNLGCMAAIGAYATQTNITYPAQFYRQGTPVEDMLISFAKRNGWYIGEGTTVNGRTEYPNIKCNVLLPRELWKPEGSDIDFINSEIVPLCNSTVDNIGGYMSSTTYWDVILYPDGGRISFMFLPYAKRKQLSRVWDYSYGTSTQSEVISLTNTIDYTFLIEGLTVKIPVTASEAYLEDEKGLVTKYSEMIGNRWENIQSIMERHNLPVPDIADFKLKLQLTYIENADHQPIEARVIDSVKKAIMTLNVMDLEVIGNPKIMPTDIVRLKVKNNDGHDNIASGLWKIVYITEEIGLQGYKTKLKLVREDSDILTYTSDKVMKSRMQEFVPA